MAWSRNRKSVFPKPTYVKLNRSLDPAQCTVDRLARRDTSRQVRNRRSPIAAWITVNADEILDRSHDFGTFNPACRLTDASVPLGMSSPRLPLTVTRPGFVGCLN
jgi:hypothetical protein